MKIVEEFKNFALKGNVVDMAVGVMIGAAFGKITTSLVNDVLMPPLGFLVGGADFSNLKITLPSSNPEIPVTINYGVFINTILDFAIIAFVLFLLIKAVNRLHRKEVAPPAAPPRQEVLLMEIRDLLKKSSLK